MNRLKRAIDLTIAGPALILSAPVQALAALAISSSLGRPVIFIQRRPGLNADAFSMRKFRTMHPVDPAKGWTDDETRLTRTGRFLRASSIDELPTLVNVLRGDMSLVGPRPLLMEYLDKYTPDQARRMEVRPGLTGLAQVSGRNAQSWNERFELDLFYVDNQSILLDLKILAKTVWTVLSRKGIASDGHVTMPKFEGPSPC
ncbi:sugar transferase [Dietzia maris]|uniref:sugar transferase n=1 Tax=Dietzia maris TaxID=37915 RepID=UPI0022B3D22E|nr:sugar transferase [Dietzia maris]MCZ4541823.1 sugar transferase [Dietzia maris]